MPSGEGVYEGYYHASPECWSVYCEVLGAEYQDAVLFGRVHQLTVDSYAAQHAGGPHPDKSVCIHLVGLHLALEHGIAPPEVPAGLQALARVVRAWPRFEPPEGFGSITALDVALARSAEEHASLVRSWAQETWERWKPHHAAVAALALLRFGNAESGVTSSAST